MAVVTLEGEFPLLSFVCCFCFWPWAAEAWS